MLPKRVSRKDKRGKGALSTYHVYRDRSCTYVGLPPAFPSHSSIVPQLLPTIVGRDLSPADRIPLIDGCGVGVCL